MAWRFIDNGTHNRTPPGRGQRGEVHRSWNEGAMGDHDLEHDHREGAGEIVHNYSQYLVIQIQFCNSMPNPKIKSKVSSPQSGLLND